MARSGLQTLLTFIAANDTSDFSIVELQDIGIILEGWRHLSAIPGDCVISGFWFICCSGMQLPCVVHYCHIVPVMYSNVRLCHNIQTLYNNIAHFFVYCLTLDWVCSLVVRHETQVNRYTAMISYSCLF